MSRRSSRFQRSPPRGPRAEASNCWPGPTERAARLPFVELFQGRDQLTQLFWLLGVGVEKLLRRHGEYLLHRDEIVLRRIAPFRRSGQPGGVGREGHQLHPALKRRHVRQVVRPGEHDAGDGPDRPGGNVDAPDALGQRALPARVGDGVGPGCFQHGGGVRPCVQKLHVAETIRFRQDVHHGFRADIKPRLRIEGIHIRRDDGAEGGVRQLLGMVDLVDGRAPRHASVRIG